MDSSSEDEVLHGRDVRNSKLSVVFIVLHYVLISEGKVYQISGRHDHFLVFLPQQ